jgi:hypothetical protein
LSLRACFGRHLRGLKVRLTLKILFEEKSIRLIKKNESTFKGPKEMCCASFFFFFFFSKSWFANDISLSHEIYYFEKYVTNSWDGNTSFGNQLFKQKFDMFSISWVKKKKKTKK